MAWAMRCARFKTGSTYSSRGNCLCTADEAVRRRTIALLKSFVDLAARWKSGDRFRIVARAAAAMNRIGRRVGPDSEALREMGQWAVERDVTICFRTGQPRRGRLSQHDRRGGRLWSAVEPFEPAADDRHLPHQYRRKGHFRRRLPASATFWPMCIFPKLTATCSARVTGRRPDLSIAWSKSDSRAIARSASITPAKPDASASSNARPN